MQINVQNDAYFDFEGKTPSLRHGVTMTTAFDEYIASDEELDLKKLVNQEYVNRAYLGFFYNQREKDEFLSLADYFRGLADFVAARGEETPVRVKN